MKKVLLIALGLVTGATMYAQENKMFIGGSAGFMTDNYKDANDETNDVKGSNWNFGPNFAYHLNEKMAVGVNLSFTGGSTTGSDAFETKWTSSGYNIQPYLRYYFAGTEKFKFFGDVAVGFGGGKTTTETNIANSKSESKYSTLNAGVYAGAQYWFNPNWSMATTIGMLGYNSMTDNVGESDAAGKSIETTNSGFGLMGDFNAVSFSMFYHF